MPDEIVDAAEVFDHHALDPQVVAPHLLDEFGVVSALDVDPAGQCDPRLAPGTATEPDAVRAGAAGAARRGAVRITGLPVDQVAGSDRERFPAAVPVLELHPAVLDADHRADVAGLGVLDDHADFHRLLGATGLSVRVVGEDIGAIAISHRVIVGSHPCCSTATRPKELRTAASRLCLRRWDAPRAKPGGTQRHRRGHRFASTTSPSTRAATASPPRRRAPRAIRTPRPRRQELDRRPAKHTYVITVSYLAPDERPELAADDRLSAADVDAIAARLRRWDAAAETPWTRKYLEMIGANEAVRAPDLAARVGLDVPRFKRRVRQLKGLGLTISLDVGYRLSPRGKAFLGR